MSIERIGLESKQELEKMVTNEIDQIEKDLTVICSQVPVNDKTALDILCHDNSGQLVVLQLNVSEDDNMLLQGIQSLDYVEKFRSFLKATYSKHKINDESKPRLVLVAPSFSETLRHAVEHMQGIHIDLYEWEYLKLGDHKGLRLQPLFTWKTAEKLEPKKQKKPTENKKETKIEKTKKEKPQEKDETKSEPPEEEFPRFPFSTEEPEEPEEAKEEPEPEKKKEPQRRKLKLF